jgi:amidase
MKRRDFLHTAGITTLGATVPVTVAGAAGAEVALAEDVRLAREFAVAERSIADLQSAMARGEVTAAALTLAYLARIERIDRGDTGFHAVLATNPAALAAASALDAERRAGTLRGPLHGIPLIIKDNIETRDPLPTTAGSLALAASIHETDADLVARLRRAGAIVLGKSNLSEWANYRSTRSVSGWSGVGGQTHNAYARDRNPSGSSSGSAVAAALSLCAAAVGSETDGSILAPSSVNGLVGLKPTVGLISGSGIVPISPRQDTAGPMARSVADVAVLLACMADKPPGDIRPEQLAASGVRGLRIGVVAASPAHPAVGSASRDWPALFERAGATVIDVKTPIGLRDFGDLESEAMSYEFKAAINAYLARLSGPGLPRSLEDLISFNEAHAREEMVHFGQELFLEAQARGDLRTPRYVRTLSELSRLTDRDGLASMFRSQSVDLLLSPCNGPAEIIDPVLGDRSDATGGWPAICSAAAVAGYPSITVPAMTVQGLPVGIAMVAPRLHEANLLRAALAFETATKARQAPRASA